MKKKLSTIVAVGACAAAVALWGPSAPLSAWADAASASEHEANIERATTLIGLPVRNAQGEDLGRTEDILLSEDGRKAAHLVIAPSAEGIETKRVHVKLKHTTLSPDRASLIHDVSAADFAVAAMEPAEAHAWSRSVAALLGARVLDPYDQHVGKVRDLLVDLKSGRVETATIATSGFLGFGEKLASVDFATVEMPFAEAEEGTKQVRIALSEADVTRQSYAAGEYWEMLGFGETEAPAALESPEDAPAEAPEILDSPEEPPADATPESPVDPDAARY